MKLVTIYLKTSFSDKTVNDKKFSCYYAVKKMEIPYEFSNLNIKTTIS